MTGLMRLKKVNLGLKSPRCPYFQYMVDVRSDMFVEKNTILVSIRKENSRKMKSSSGRFENVRGAPHRASSYSTKSGSCWS